MGIIERVEYLEKLVKAQNEKNEKHTFPVRWRDEDLYLPVVRVPTSFLKYRLQNGRTRDKQIEYLEKHPNEQKDLFLDPESEKAQKAQHIILLNMIDKKGLKKDLLREGQRQPAIITYDGYVLNGNRRLAALRESDKQYMNCLVLPKDATPRDLYELELDLQMAIDTKAEYEWINELLHIRYGIHVIKEDIKIVAKKMRTGPQEIRSKINMLHLVDLYLSWFNRIEHYHIVGDNEQAFIELEKYTRKIKNPDKQKEFRNIVFTLITYPPDTGRLYDHIRNCYNNIDEVTKKIAKNTDKEKIIKIKKVKADSHFEDNPLEELASEPDIIEDITEETKLFDQLQDAEINVQTLVDAIQDATAEATDKKDRKATINAVKEAHRKLQGIIIDSKTSDLNSIEKKLIEIIRLAKELIDNIQRQGSSNGN